MQRTVNLEKLLQEKPFLFEFSQAVFLFYKLIKKDRIDLVNDNHLFFRSIALLNPSSHDILRVVQDKDVRNRWTVSSHFLSLTGVQGPFPMPYTERLLSLMRSRNFSLTDFLDFFHHRLISVFFHLQRFSLPALWGKHLIENPVSKCLISLSGVPYKKQSQDRVQFNLSAADFLWARPKSRERLVSALKILFNVSVSVHSFFGEWWAVPQKRQGRLGHSKISQAVLGKNVWRQDSAVLIILSLESPQDFLDFLPTGQKHGSLKNFLQGYLGCLVRPKVGLRLWGQKNFSLGTQSAPMYLGWTSWLCGPDTKTDNNHHIAYLNA